MTSMHRREKRSSFCSLIDIFFKIDIILVRIYHRRVLKLAGSSWCGKSRYGEAYHPIWEPGKFFSTETIWRSFEGKKRKEVGTTKSHGKALSMEMKNSQASKSNYMKITIKRKNEWISFFHRINLVFFLHFRWLTVAATTKILCVCALMLRMTSAGCRWNAREFSTTRTTQNRFGEYEAQQSSNVSSTRNNYVDGISFRHCVPH